MMKKFINKLPIWLMMIWPYVLFAGMALAEEAFLIVCVLTIILCIVNIVNACTYKAENPARELALWGMVTKLVHMPFYIVVFLMGIVMVLSMVMVPMTFIAPFIILFLIIMDIVFMITSSVYCAKAAMAAKDQGIMKKETAMMVSICSFIFIADVICSVIIYGQIKKNKKIKKS